MLVRLVAFVVVCAACAAASGPGGAYEPASDGTARLTGEVVENVRGCRTDGACFLRIRAGAVEVRVRYNPGEAPCANTEAAKAGLALEPGRRVSVHAQIVEAGPPPSLDTCPRKEFYIRPAD